MNLTKALALLTLTIAFWLSAAHALTVKGHAPITNRFFAQQLDCRDAKIDAQKNAENLCRRLRHRGADRMTFRHGGCWTLTRRTVTLNFECE